MRLIDADKIGLTNFEILVCNGDYKEALKMILEKIEKAPTVCDIEQIRAEIEALITDNLIEEQAWAYSYVLQIIDKYKGVKHE